MRIGLILVALLMSGCGVNTAERNNAGNDAFTRGDYDSALRAYQAAQVDSPDRPEPYYNAASALLGLAEFEQAIAALEQALLTADAELAVRAYYNLGNVFFEQREFEAAIAAYQEALLIDPNYGPARYNLELALLRFVPPTPTALEQQTNPEMGQTDPETTPTDEPGGFDGPTPTPPPAAPPDPSETPVTGDSGELGEDSSTPVPRDEGSMTLEEAARILDAVQQDQEALREYLESAAASGDAEGPDW